MSKMMRRDDRRRRPTSDEIAAGLLAARELMNNKGDHWNQGAPYRLKPFIRRNGQEVYESCFCAYGAIRAVAGTDCRSLSTYGDPRFEEAMLQQLAKTIASSKLDYRQTPENSEHEDNPTMIVFCFNDSYITTWGQVSRMFRLAARRMLAEKTP